MSTNQSRAQNNAEGVAVAPTGVALHTRENDVTAEALRRRKRNRRLALAGAYGILVVAVVFAIYPVYFAFLVSIRPNGQLLSLNLVDMLIPATGVYFYN